MKRATHTVEWLRIALWVTTTMSRLLATYAIIQGVNVLLVGPERWWGSPALAPALEVPGQTATWGLVLAAGGLLAMYGSLTRRMALCSVGHVVGALWSFFFALTQTAAAIQTTAPTTGIVVYAAEGVMFMVVAVGAWQLHKSTS